MNWAYAPWPSIPRKTASPCTASRPTKPTSSARAKGPWKPTWMSKASSPWPKRKVWTPSTRATDSSRRTPSCRAPANAPASPSSDPRPVCSTCWATRPPRAASPHNPEFRAAPAPSEAVTNPKQAAKIAGEIGYPLIVKAAFGGGGRGMRVVDKPEDFAGKLEEARQESAAAFGNDAVFLERFVRRAKHIEVQILGDLHGNILHLYERDCSVQRRHQKVVEVAPAVSLAPKIRAELADAAVTLARAAGYTNAGTVEFLVDADTGEWFFIEVNPRIQVEHTVTEMVTGIDLVRCQIQITQGLGLHGPEMNLPPQDRVPLYGYALQCRITTEDPANGFVPDYGKISTYRAPAGFGIRLDGGSAYSGSVITPFYDSLLVKTTAWGREFPHACQRMDRCLREFRVRGVKTNIPFLENVVNHPDFQAGNVSTGWLEETPALFKFVPRQDRATKLLGY